MNNYNDLILKKPVKYGKITLTLNNTKGDYHMFTGLKNQLELSDSLIENILPHDNELVKLKKILNWEGINTIYKSCFNSKEGNKTKTTNIALGLILLKHLYKKSDRSLINELHLNNSYMYFCSLSYDEVAEANRLGIKLIDHSTLVKIRKRLGAEKISAILSLFTSELIKNKIIDGKYLFTDTTSLEKNIIYPTDVSLLSRVIKEADYIIQNVIRKKNVIISSAVKKAKTLSKIYYSSSKKTKDLLNKTATSLARIAKAQLTVAGVAANNMAESISELNIKRYKKLKEVGRKIVRQAEKRIKGVKVRDKILSYYEDHTSALPKGKVGKPCEFGTKLSLSMSANGYITAYKLYNSNIADILTLKEMVSKHSKTFGKKFKGAAADRAYYDEDLIKVLEKKHKIDLAIPHKKNRDIKMEPDMQDLYDRRAAIEARISEGKRMCGLNKSYYKGFDGDRMWATLGVMALNMRKLIRDISKNPELILRFAG
jgi:transposase